MKGKLEAEDGRAVHQFLEELNIDHPFPESDDYYSRSSWSEHDNMFEAMHRGALENVFKVATEQQSLLVDTDTYQHVAADLEKLFVIGHALSAVKSELNITDGAVTTFYPSSHPSWHHGPFVGGFTTITDKWGDDPRVPIGRIVTDSNALRADSLVVQVHAAYNRVFEEFYEPVFPEGGYGLRVGSNSAPPTDPEKIAAFRAELQNLHTTLKTILEQIIARIRACC